MKDKKGANLDERGGGKELRSIEGGGNYNKNVFVRGKKSTFNIKGLSTIGSPGVCLSSSYHKHYLCNLQTAFLGCPGPIVWDN